MSDATVIRDALGKHGLATIFVYDQVTPTVKAGRRYPITARHEPDWVRVVLDVEADVDAAPPPHANLADAEYTDGAGKRVPLWTAHLACSPAAGDRLRFTVAPD